MGSAKSVSSDFLKAAQAERDLLGARLAEAQERVEHFETQAAEARDEAKSLADSIRVIEEVAGLAPQLAMCELSEVRPRCGASRARPRGQRAEPEQGPAPPVPDRGIAIVR